MIRSFAAFIFAALLTAQTVEDRLRALAAQAAAAEEREQLDEAARSYREILKLKPHWATAEMNLGLVYYSQKKFPAAIGILTEAVSHDPALSSGWLFLGASYYQTEQHQSAVSPLKRYLRSEPSSQEARSYLAGAYLGLGDHLRAAGEYAELIRINPRQEEFYFRFTDCYLQSAATLLKRLGEESRAEAFFLLISAEELLPADKWALGEEQIRKAISMNPSASEGYFALGRHLSARGQGAKAEAAFAEARKLDQHPPRCQAPAPPLERARCLADRGDLSAATVALLTARAAPPAHDPRTLYWTFRISKTLAQKSIDRLAALSPQSPFLSLLRAQMSEQNGRNEEADYEYQRAIAQSPSADAFVRYGKLKCRLNQFDEALKLYGRALEFDPDSALTKALIGEVYLLGEEPERALPYLEAAVRASPRDTQTRLYLARCLERLNRHADSIVVLEDAPADAGERIPFALGNAYKRAGEQEKARRAFEEFRRRKGQPK